MQLQTDASLMPITVVQGLYPAVTDVMTDCSGVLDRQQQRNNHQDMSLSRRSSIYCTIILFKRLGKAHKRSTETDTRCLPVCHSHAAILEVQCF